MPLKAAIFFMFFVVLSLSFSGMPAWSKDTAGPQAALTGYRQALASGEREQVFFYLSAQSKLMMKDRPYSEDMMLREAETLKECTVAKVRVKAGKAVLFFMPEDTLCSPYFFVYDGQDWKVDLITMAQVIRFDRANNWSVDQNIKHPYVFAFSRKD